MEPEQAEILNMAEKSDTKEKLIEATLELISEKGYLGASTREIANLAEVSELTLFRHFGKKEALFEEVLNSRTFLPRLIHLLEEVQGMSCREALETIGIQYVETLKERKRMVRIILSEFNTYPEKVRRVHMRFVRDMEKAVEGYLEGLRAEGKMRQLDSGTAARIFLRTLFSHFVVECIIRGRELPPMEVAGTVKDFVDIFMNGIIVQDNKE